MRKARFVLGLLWPYKGRVGLGLTAMLIATAAGLAPPLLAKEAIDAGIVPRDVSALDWAVAGFVAAALIYAGATFVQTYMVGWVGTRALQDLRERIFSHLQEMSIGFFTRRSPGVLISRLTNDVEALNQLVSTGAVTLVSSLLTLFGAVVILLALDLRLALVTFLTFPVLIAASALFRVVSHGAYRATRERIAAVTAYLQETLSGVRIVRSFGQEPRHASAMTELNEANREANMRTVYLNATYFPGVELLSAIGTAAILLYGGSQAIDGAIQVGVVVAFVGYLQIFFEPIQQLSNLYTTWLQGVAAMDKIFELLETPTDMPDAPGAIDPGRLRGEIELDGVWFSYSEGGEWALEDVDLHVPPGQTLALVGATGAGKSTFAKLVARFYDPQRGRVMVDGHDLRELRQRALRRQLGIVPGGLPLFRQRAREHRLRPPRRDAGGDRDGGVRSRRRGVHRRSAKRNRDRGRRARRAALGRSAPARRLRPGADRRAPHPHPRRGDLQRRRAHRAHDRARPCPSARRSHGDRHRPPPIDDPPRRQDRRARGRPGGRGRNPRRADRRGGRLRPAVRGVGGVFGGMRSSGVPSQAASREFLGRDPRGPLPR